VFQVPDKAPIASESLLEALRRRLFGQALADLRQTVALRSRLAHLVGRSRYAMEMHVLNEEDVETLIGNAGGSVADVAFTNASVSNYGGNLVYLDQAPKSDWLVSKQYTVIRAQKHQRFTAAQARIDDATLSAPVSSAGVRQLPDRFGSVQARVRTSWHRDYDTPSKAAHILRISGAAPSRSPRSAWRRSPETQLDARYRHNPDRRYNGARRDLSLLAIKERMLAAQGRLPLRLLRKRAEHGREATGCLAFAALQVETNTAFKETNVARPSLSRVHLPRAT
jgi:hypothetical protein